MGVAYHSNRDAAENGCRIAEALGRQALPVQVDAADEKQVEAAIGISPGGPWTQHDDPLPSRRDRWDSFHLSTGPLID